MWILKGICIASAILLSAATASASNSQKHVWVEAHLLQLARAYEMDSKAFAGAFGVEVEGVVWTINVADLSDDTFSASLSAGEPQAPTFVFRTNLETFKKIADGTWSAVTAMGRARAGDPAPMDIRFSGEFRPGADFQTRFLSIAQHFWNPGFPKIIPFGYESARTVHGAEATVLYYKPGHLRSAWFGLLPGQHVNPDPRDQVNDFDTLFVILRGGGVKSRIGGKPVELGLNKAVFVPAGMSHEFWNDGDEPGEVIMIAFGPSA